MDNTFIRNQICDISMGGLSFCYMDNGCSPVSGAYGVDVINGGGRQLCKVFFKTVSDCETGVLISHNQKVKRHSIRFERLSSDQKGRLKKVIQEHTIGPV